MHSTREEQNKGQKFPKKKNGVRVIKISGRIDPSQCYISVKIAAKKNVENETNECARQLMYSCPKLRLQQPTLIL